MRDYFGKNGCYEIVENDDNQDLLEIYLNSPIIYEGDDFNRATAENRIEPDVEFVIIKEKEDDEIEDWPASMEVLSLGLHGVNEFVSALLARNIGDKDELLVAVKELLDQEGAVWGVISPEEE